MSRILNLVRPGEVPATEVLAEATQANLVDAVVVGWDKDGHLYFHSSYANGPETLWLLDQAKHSLLEAGRT